MGKHLQKSEPKPESRDLRSQLEGLFDEVPEAMLELDEAGPALSPVEGRASIPAKGQVSEPSPATAKEGRSSRLAPLESKVAQVLIGAQVAEEEREADLLLEEAVTSLLSGEPVLSGAEATLEVSPPLPTAEVGQVSIPSKARSGRRKVALPLLRGVTMVTILGTALLVSLLVLLVWPNAPRAPRPSPFLLAVALTITLILWAIQWTSNWWLTKALGAAEEELANRDGPAARLYSRRPLENRERAEELATANAALQKQTLQLQAATQIARALTSAISTSADADELMQQAVDLIREQFDLYFVGLFLIVDPFIRSPSAAPSPDQLSARWAVLRAGTGEAGRDMVARRYKLEVGGRSAVGRCLESGEPWTAPELRRTSGPSTSQSESVLSIPVLSEAEGVEGAKGAEGLRASLRGSEAPLPPPINPLLPQARSQVALPLLSRGRVIGALDVHSSERELFSQKEIGVLQTVADQVAAAIQAALENAASVAERVSALEARLKEIEARNEDLQDQRQRWADPLGAVPSYERTRPGLLPLGDALTFGGDLSRAVVEAIVGRGPVVQSQAGDGGGEAALVVPITLRDQVLGALGLEETEGQRQWTDDEVALVAEIADQMALAIENARLLGTTRQRAERERLAADIATRVRASTDVDTILRTAIRELGRALGAAEGLIRLEVPDQAGTEYGTPNTYREDEGEEA